jgi:hypothetical protein
MQALTHRGTGKCPEATIGRSGHSVHGVLTAPGAGSAAITQEAEQELEHVDEIRYRFSAPMMATFSTGRARHMRVGFLQALRVS